MRIKIINFLKSHPDILGVFWNFVRIVLQIWALFVPIKKKTIIFSSFGGRKFDDSPKALYDEICKREYFKDWKLIWAFVDPDAMEIPRGEKIKIDSYSFFKTLICSQVWICNTGMDRDIGFNRKGILKIETWHGVPLKRICGEEKTNAVEKKRKRKSFDTETIRCAQSEYDREIFSRIFNASKDSILLCDLPRNDSLTKYKADDIEKLKSNMNISLNKKVLLYIPTYREYLMDDNSMNYIAPPINLQRWREELGDEWVLLFRAHYAVNKVLNIKSDGFVIDVSSYPILNELYAISDVMISDYSSSFIDFSILGRPMLCYAYDLEEYENKRGLYIDLNKELPSKIDETEDEILNHIVTLDYEEESKKTKLFRDKYAPKAGNASVTVVDELIKKLQVV